MKHRKIFVWLIILGSNLGAATVILVRLQGGTTEDDAALWSCWIAFTLTGLLLAFALSKQDRQTRGSVSPSIFIGIPAVGIVVGLLTTSFILDFQSKNSYIALTYSSKPLNEIKPERRKLVVEALRRTAANSKANTDMAKSIKPILPPLYSAESYASPLTIQTTMQRLSDAFEIDVMYAKQQRDVMTDLRTKLAHADPAFLKQWNEARAVQEASEVAGEALEQQWVKETLNLYAYANEHSNAIRLNGSVLSFASSDVQSQFLRQEENCKRLQSEMQSSRQRLLESQKKAQTHLGVNL